MGIAPIDVRIIIVREMMVYVDFEIVVDVELARTADISTFEQNNRIELLRSDLPDLNVFNVWVLIKRERGVVFVDNGHVFPEMFSNKIKGKTGADGVPIWPEM